MDAFLVPTDVEAVLAHLGFRPVALAGQGWLAVALDGTDRRLELHVLPATVDELLSARVTRLRGLRHEHLAQLLDVVELSPGRLGLLVEHVAGLSLAQIRAARSPLSDGEAATVAIPIAGALGALHDAGLVHGAVSASTVVVRPDGRPVLTDVRSTVLAAGDPESDVRRLVTTVVALLPDEDAHLRSDVADQAVLRDALAELLTVPGLEAGRVVDRCYRVTEPVPVGLPPAGALEASSPVAGARRDRGRAAGRGRTRRDRRPRTLWVAFAVTGLVAALVTGGAARALHHPTPDAAAPGSDARGATTSALQGDASESTGAVRAGDSLAPSGAVPDDSPAASDAVLDRDDPVAAAAELSRLRAAAVAAADAGALDAAEVVDGPAHSADARLLADRAGARVDGLTVDVRDAWLVPDDGSRAGTTDVAVTAVTAVRPRASGEAAVPAVPAVPARTVVLGLRWTDDGWRVWDVVER